MLICQGLAWGRTGWESGKHSHTVTLRPLVRAWPQWLGMFITNIQSLTPIDPWPSSLHGQAQKKTWYLLWVDPPKISVAILFHACQLFHIAAVTCLSVTDTEKWQLKDMLTTHLFCSVCSQCSEFPECFGFGAFCILYFLWLLFNIFYGIFPTLVTELLNG